MITLIVYVLTKLRTAKDVVRQMSKKPRFRTPFESRHVKGSQALVKSAWQHFYHIFSSLWDILSWKMSLLVICKILRVFVNTFTVGDEHFLRNSQNLPQ